MTAPPLYALQDVRKTYGREFTLELADFPIAPGKILALLGPTGSGKSTLLKLLAGLDAPSRGAILFENQPFPAPHLPLATQRRITLVAQRSLLLHRSVQANVEYGLRLRGRRGPLPIVARLLEQLGLAPLAAQPARTLSGGQTQLVALARALAVEPDVLLLDEPTSHLDPAHVELVEQVVREHQAARPSTILWATHNLFQARRIADHVALLLGGRLVEHAEREAFFTAPRDPRTRDFVAGKMVY